MYPHWDCIFTYAGFSGNSCNDEAHNEIYTLYVMSYIKILVGNKPSIPLFAKSFDMA